MVIVGSIFMLICVVLICYFAIKQMQEDYKICNGVRNMDELSTCFCYVLDEEGRRGLIERLSDPTGSEGLEFVFNRGSMIIGFKYGDAEIARYQIKLTEREGRTYMELKHMSVLPTNGPIIYKLNAFCVYRLNATPFSYVEYKKMQEELKDGKK